ncbi:MAG: hypothetical protein ACXU8R_17245 [Xanthobacteraceae bacterium]
MISLLCFFLTLFVSPFKSKNRLEAENAALRQQLINISWSLPSDHLRSPSVLTKASPGIRLNKHRSKIERGVPAVTREADEDWGTVPRLQLASITPKLRKPSNRIGSWRAPLHG